MDNVITREWPCLGHASKDDPRAPQCSVRVSGNMLWRVHPDSSIDQIHIAHVESIRVEELGGVNTLVITTIEPVTKSEAATGV